MQNNNGEIMYGWAKDLFPINRSLTGPGVRQTLVYIKNILPELEIKSVPTGYKAFDWDVPKEWSVKEAYIENEFGDRIIDFKNNNLHLVGYSIPIDTWLSLEELNSYLYSIPDQPDAIPYVTSYYFERWGFCVSQNQRDDLKPCNYHVVIKSELKDGVLNYGELLIPGDDKKEIFLSTYICHPSMANNELSGPVVTTAMAKWINSLKKRRFSYRIVFIPETIGSLVYLSKNLKEMRKLLIGGFNITCVGDDRCYSYIPSRSGDTYSDKIAKHVLSTIDENYKIYSWLDRGSDERQYCAPGIDLPIATITRSKYGEYPEYHTSNDDLNLISPKGLEGSFEALKRCIEIMEMNLYYKVNVLGEPQLGKRNLYPTISSKGSAIEVRDMMNFLSFCDGKHSLLEISEEINVSINILQDYIEKFVKADLISPRNNKS